MNIEDSKSKMIFRTDKDGKTYYQIGLSHKKQDNTYENGYMMCRFPKAADIPNKTKIMLVNAWIDFWVDDKKITHPYIFINKYEIIDENKVNEIPKDIPQNINSEYEGIQLTDDELPF